jgi:hypothetical protein
MRALVNAGSWLFCGERVNLIFILSINFGIYLRIRLQMLNMKKLLIPIILLLNLGVTRAQRFFYIETNDNTENVLKNDLLKAAQFVTESPIASDYIIRTDIGIQKGSDILTLNMILQDSVTFNTIFQTREEYNLGVIGEGSKIFLKMVITAFIDKNLNRIVLCARDDHYSSGMRNIKPRKDKT